MIRLLDISANQPRVNWPAVVDAGYSAAMIKATEGVGCVDPCLDDHVRSAHANALEVGVYHYLRVRHGKPQDAREQARQYIQAWIRSACELRPCVDVERGQNEAATGAEFAEAVTSFVDQVEKDLHVTPIIYASRGEWYSEHLESLTSLSRCPLWLAAYVPTPLTPAPWTSYVAWQFTGVGTIPGALVDHDGPLDLSTTADLAPMRMPQ